jgi:hypothetical protein
MSTSSKEKEDEDDVSHKTKASSSRSSSRLRSSTATTTHSYSIPSLSDMAPRLSATKGATSSSTINIAASNRPFLEDDEATQVTCDVLCSLGKCPSTKKRGTESTHAESISIITDAAAASGLTGVATSSMSFEASTDLTSTGTTPGAPLCASITSSRCPETTRTAAVTSLSKCPLSGTASMYDDEDDGENDSYSSDTNQNVEYKRKCSNPKMCPKQMQLPMFLSSTLVTTV